MTVSWCFLHMLADKWDTFVLHLLGDCMWKESESIPQKKKKKRNGIVWSKLKSTTKICLLFMKLAQDVGKKGKSALVYTPKDKEKPMLRESNRLISSFEIQEGVFEWASWKLCYLGFESLIKKRVFAAPWCIEIIGCSGSIYKHL